MLRLDRLRPATSGLASELDESSPEKSDCATEPLSSSKVITILLDQSDDDATAYLRLARSLHQNVQRSSDYASLSADQVRAVWTLRDCSDVDIRTWLKEARTLGETVYYLLKLRELTTTSKRLCKASFSSRRLPSTVQLQPPLFLRPSAKESTRSCR